MNQQKIQNAVVRFTLMTAFVFCIASGACTRRVYETRTMNTPSFTDDCNTTATFSVDGQYQGKNLYCQNPYVNCIDSTSRFVTVRVTINDTIVIPPDSTASSAFEIPLMSYGFQMNDPVHIVFEHYTSGKPRLLNPEIH